MPRAVVTLPEDEQRKLREVRQSGDLNELRQRVLALRQKMWPLRAIGDPLDAPRSTVRMWELSADPSLPTPDVPECHRAIRERGEKVTHLRLDVPVSRREELKELASKAKLLRGYTPADSPVRLASNQLDALIAELVAHHVPVKRIAEHMGVTPRAVTARYERFQERSK